MDRIMPTKKDLLQLLRETDGYVSGEAVSEKLGITRAAVWKQVELLRAEGYVIDSLTRRGYRLREAPDLLTQEEIQAGLSAGEFGCRVFAMETVDSTNEEAKRRAEQDAPHGSVFVAEQQTGGKGRLGRRWDSAAGSGLWFSLLLRPRALPSQTAGITLLAGLAVCRAIRRETGCQASIKWPNDVVLGTKKVCGILTEMSAEMDQIHYVVVGIGINVKKGAFPAELQEKAVSLEAGAGRPVRRVPLLQRILEEFELLYREYGVSSFPLEEYSSLCVSLGRRIRFFRNGSEVHGTAVAVEKDGGLVAELENGETAVVTSGEVVVQGFYGQ